MLNIHHTQQEQDILEKKFLVDGKVIKKTDVYHKSAPKEIRVEYIFNMHTHPIHDYGYSFFSKQDIDSMLSSGAIITGLVTDHLWLLMRSSDTPSLCNMEEKDINEKSLRDEMKMGVYCADFHRKCN